MTLSEMQSAFAQEVEDAETQSDSFCEADVDDQTDLRGKFSYFQFFQFGNKSLNSDTSFQAVSKKLNPCVQTASDPAHRLFQQGTG
jgi:hypothetical protein